MKNKLEENVIEFINKCSCEIGKFTDMDFNFELWSECLNLGIKSPIEQILYCALKTIGKLNRIESSEPRLIEDKEYIVGLGVYPQQKIENFRVDFEVFYGECIYGKYTYKSIIIECDSQQFHERSEQERRYEKARDRFFTKQGIKVFHYTGSEIVKNSFKIAIEIIHFVTGIEDLIEDSNG